jgi:hypothetical protein
VTGNIVKNSIGFSSNLGFLGFIEKLEKHLPRTAEIWNK